MESRPSQAHKGAEKWGHQCSFLPHSRCSLLSPQGAGGRPAPGAWLQASFQGPRAGLTAWRFQSLRWLPRPDLGPRLIRLLSLDVLPPNRGSSPGGNRSPVSLPSCPKNRGKYLPTFPIAGCPSPRGCHPGNCQHPKPESCSSHILPVPPCPSA